MPETKKTVRMWSDVPDGYIPGQNRLPDSDQKSKKLKTHLYKGDFHGIEGPMCLDGWNRDDHTSFSIWRNNVGDAGFCKRCMARALKGMGPVEAKAPRCWKHKNEMHKEECDYCDGDGYFDAESSVVCKECWGDGVVWICDICDDEKTN